jgi:two-component system NarL family response regulator
MNPAALTGDSGLAAPPPISILIADDHPLILAGLASLIASHPRLALAGQACTGMQAVALYAQHRPQVVLMDLNMPEMNGVEAIRQICQLHADARIVVLTTYQGDEDVYRGLCAGARGYLLKDSPVEQVERCILTVAAGGKFLPLDVAAKLAQRMDCGTLSKRELEILAHLSTGQSNKLIARNAGIGVGTVKFHVNNILSKLNVSSRTEAATVAAQRGLLTMY